MTVRGAQGKWPTELRYTDATLIRTDQNRIGGPCFLLFYPCESV
jgi:hypothetical protein